MAYDVTVRRENLRGCFDLKGEQKAVASWLAGIDVGFPSVPNTKSLAGETDLLWIGPDHWLFRCPLEQEAGILARHVPEEISMVLVSDTLSTFLIEGAEATQIMAIACPLDTNLATSPKNAATYTEAFGLKALVCRRPNGFELSVESSFADMLEDCLARAAGT